MDIITLSAGVAVIGSVMAMAFYMGRLDARVRSLEESEAIVDKKINKISFMISELREMMAEIRAKI